MSGGNPRKEAGRGRAPAGTRPARIVAAIVFLLLVLALAAGLLRRFGGPSRGSRVFVAKAPPPPAARAAAGAAAAGATAVATAPAREPDGGIAESRGIAGGPEADRQPPPPDPGASRPPVVLDDGELRIFLSGSASLPVVIGASRIPFAVESRGGAAEVLVASVPDGTAAVSVLSGAVDVVAGGRRVPVGAGTFTTVAGGAPPAPAEAPPPPPELAAPSPDATYYYGAAPPRITFSWRPRGAADGFRLVLARDPAFRQVVVDERVAGRRATHDGLEEGTYYWRVSAARKGAASFPADAVRLKVVRRKRPPGLAVRPAARVDGGSAWLVTGRTEPGAKVFVSGNPVAVSETGAFSCRLRRGPAPRAVVVEAVDRFGNAAYDRQWVY